MCIVTEFERMAVVDGRQNELNIGLGDMTFSHLIACTSYKNREETCASSDSGVSSDYQPNSTCSSPVDTHHHEGDVFQDLQTLHQLPSQQWGPVGSTNDGTWNNGASYMLMENLCDSATGMMFPGGNTEHLSAYVTNLNVNPTANPNQHQYPPTEHYPVYQGQQEINVGNKITNSSFDLSQVLPALSTVTSIDQIRCKPKRKRIITKVQRTAANNRERRRMLSLNTAFDSLRERIPTFSYEKKLSRIETLKLAMTYISFMSDLIEGVDPKQVTLHPGSTQSQPFRREHHSVCT